MPNEIIKKIEPAFEDERGAISNILEEPITHVAIITSKKGAIRANHYHPDQSQYVYLISGSYESVSKDLKNKNTKIERQIIKPGHLVITPPMIAHAWNVLEDSVMLNLTTGRRDSKNYKEHTIKYELI
ncbi:dTDP-4-dehydrorhamnose 3,5-epimerase family protein [Candidatus Woesearchaeota archaeon]|nr:dTDP-4-dehydrorhamnose 3,5-epimerase family protein [Candidatus Woesearchaeota archaeon]